MSKLRHSKRKTQHHSPAKLQVHSRQLGASIRTGRPVLSVGAVLVGIPLGLAIGPKPAYATANSGTESSPVLQEVVVTATRVRTNAEKTPVSMEVISQSQLFQKGVVDLQSLTEADPSLNFASGDGSAGIITMRGIAGGQGFGGAGIGTPSVPISFDGFYYDSDVIFNAALYDIKRVEVLRGPQGTLFGRNSTGGLIHVVTNKPGKKFGGYGELTFGNYNTLNAQGALNVPINDKLQMRFAFFSAQHSGYHVTSFTNLPVDNRDAKSGRVQVAFEPESDLRFLFSFQQTHVGGAGATDNIYVLPADANNMPTHAAFNLSKLDQYQYNITFPSKQSINDKLVQWRAVYTGLPYGMTLTYLGGFDQLRYFHSNPVVGADITPYQIPTTIELTSSLDPNTQNEEIRVNSASNQAVTWQGGVYYFRSNIGNNLSRFKDAAQPTQPDIVDFFYNDESRSIAAYGQGDWTLGSTIFSAGARYTRDYLSRTDLTSPQDGIFPARESVQYAKWTYHVGEQWNITNHNMMYAKIDTGYSAGAFNLNIPCNCTGGPPQPTTIQPYKPEYVTTYELGTKNFLFAHHVILNADTFYSRYKGEQMLQSNAGGIVTVNAKTSNIYGVEVEFAALGRLGKLNFNATWLHARFDSQLFTNGIGQTYNIGGNMLVQAPEVSLSASFEHTFAVGSGTLTPVIGTKFQSGQYFDFYNQPDSYQPAYTRSYAELNYAPENGNWSIGVYVHNLENSIVMNDESESFAPPLTQPGTYNVDFQSPRTYGISISDRF